MTLEDLGYNDVLEKFRMEQNLEDFEPGRVISEHKERYIVKTGKGEYEAEITGNMRFTANGREDYPAVGDWVAITVYDAGSAVIHRIFPRKTVIERKAVAKFGEKQIIAANLDHAFIMQSADRDFNINRIDRYLTICHSAGVEPIVILSKTDLVNESGLESIMNELRSRIKNTRIIPLSNQTEQGYDRLRQVLVKGRTYCFLGSSGVGKSTLINNLTGRDSLKAKPVSTSTGKGRHTTSHRELVVLDNGSMVIDNPGMREVGIADTAGGLEITFDAIIRISRDCKFTDCTHTREKGCAVLDAVDKGVVDKASYENYLKMEKEKMRFRKSVAEKRKQDKAFGKICREGVKYRKQRKY